MSKGGRFVKGGMGVLCSGSWHLQGSAIVSGGAPSLAQRKRRLEARLCVRGLARLA